MLYVEITMSDNSVIYKWMYMRDIVQIKGDHRALDSYISVEEINGSETVIRISNMCSVIEVSDINKMVMHNLRGVL